MRIEVALQESSRLQVVLTLVRKPHHTRERIGIGAVAAEGLPKVALGAIDIARAVSAVAGVGQSRSRRRITGTRDRTAKVRLRVGPSVAPTQEHGVAVRDRRIGRLEIERPAVMPLGVVDVAELIMRERERVMRRRHPLIERQRALQVVDREVRPPLT